ncbi:unnamed protein product [Toxocara canis]|uniref:Secreted protein n=1 Tax=Toxocara canis TaxID=6265 RepID=A0A3P7FQB2_TOXCA|nr:unnamed protein product [Toxocara canis]
MLFLFSSLPTLTLSVLDAVNPPQLLLSSPPTLSEVKLSIAFVLASGWGGMVESVESLDSLGSRRAAISGFIRLAIACFKSDEPPLPLDRPFGGRP